jgi:DNA polymerase III subunit delta
VSSPLPVYLVRGDDPVLRGEAVRTLVHELVGDGDPSLTVEEHEPPADDADTTAIADAAQTPPFLTERRVVVARDVSSYSTEALQPLLGYLADPLPTTSLVLVAGGGRLAPKLLEAVKRIGHVVDTAVPQQKRGRGAWLADRLKGAPVRLDPAAVELVDEHLGDDLGRLPNILETLAAAYGHGARIGADDLRPFLGEAGAVPPWELTDAIDTGDTAGALRALHRILEGGDRHPLQVMATLHGHFGRMLRLDGADVADEAQAAAALGMKGSTFPAKKALTQVRRLGHAGVAEALRLLAEADLDLRGMRKDWPESLVMEVLVARLSRLGARTRRR